MPRPNGKGGKKKLLETNKTSCGRNGLMNDVWTETNDKNVNHCRSRHHQSKYIFLILNEVLVLYLVHIQHPFFLSSVTLYLMDLYISDFLPFRAEN